MYEDLISKFLSSGIQSLRNLISDLLACQSIAPTAENDVDSYRYPLNLNL